MSEMIPAPAPEVVFAQWLENLRVDVAETIAGVALRGARPVPIGSSYGGTKRPLNSPGALVGYSLWNPDATNPATVRILFHDAKEPGELEDAIFVVSLGPGESVREWFGPGGVHLGTGLYVDAQYDAGTPAKVIGAVFLRGVE